MTCWIIWTIAAVLVTFTMGYVGYSRYLTQFVELDEEAGNTGS